jgi:hypothetical protein
MRTDCRGISQPWLSLPSKLRSSEASKLPDGTAGIDGGEHVSRQSERLFKRWRTSFASQRVIGGSAQDGGKTLFRPDAPQAIVSANTCKEPNGDCIQDAES